MGAGRPRSTRLPARLDQGHDRINDSRDILNELHEGVLDGGEEEGKDLGEVVRRIALRASEP